MNRFDLHDKFAVMTGGNGYLGKAMLKALAENGCKVLSAARRPCAEKLCGVTGFLCDLSDKSAAAQIAKKAAELNGHVDILINCACYGGGSGGNSPDSGFEKIIDGIWENSVDGALNQVMRLIREVAPLMREGGSIINVSSMYGIVAPDFAVYGDDIPFSPASYGAGKAGMLALTRYCASYFGKHGIRVNSITPGAFPDPGKNNAEFIGRLADRTLLGRVGRPEDLIGAILLLASDMSSYMTGSNLIIDGGWTVT